MMRPLTLLIALLSVCLTAYGTTFAQMPKSQATVLMLGDSLTSGLGVMPEQAWPARVQEMCDRHFSGSSTRVRVINAGISGSTTAGAHARLKWYLKAGPKVMVLALGANDGLRGLSVPEMRSNLDKAIRLAKASGIRVVLAGMEVPPNYGPGYAADFRRTFPDLAALHNIPLIPFLLDRVAGIPELNQADGIHPNAEGHRIIAETVLPYILENL